MIQARQTSGYLVTVDLRKVNRPGRSCVEGTDGLRGGWGLGLRVQVWGLRFGVRGVCGFGFRDVTSMQG